MSLVESNVWENVLRAIKTKLQSESFETWFNPIRFEGIDNTRRLIRLRAPNQVVRDWVNVNYANLMDQSFGELSLSGYSVDWVLPEENPKLLATSRSPEQAEAPAGHSQSPDVSPGAVQYSASSVGTALAPARQVAFDPSLNSKYTFDSFVVGSCNQFAHAASLAVAEAPGRTYNPLYLYGGVGLGKTHLMHACGHAIKQRNPHLRVSYLSSERFMNELINSIRYDKTQGFREKYRSVDVLLIDDIQFKAGNERTQEEFFHTFNTLYEQQKQIVISSDCPPREIPTLEERLHSRFEWGLIADLEPPDLETKIAVLRKKAETEKINLPDNVALFMAGKIKSNIRELEGSLVRLTALSSIKGKSINLLLAQEALKNIVEEEERAITIETIQKVVADFYNLKVADLKSKTNSRNIAVPRQIAMYLCKTLTKASLPEIGREFGGKHHTTVMHSINKISDLYDQKGHFHRIINSLIDSCK